MKRIQLLVLLSSLLSLPAQADTLYGIDVPGNLFAIDLATGAGTLVGVLPDGPYMDGPPGYNEIEYDPTSGRAWAQQRAANFAIQQFDIGTGAGIGAPIPNGSSWHGLEYVGGTLYAAGFEWEPNASGVGIPSLATLDPATGASTLIGPFDLAEGGVITGLAYDAPTQTMYGINGGGDRLAVSTLYTVDLATGAATPIGATGMKAGSLEFGPDGNLYAGGVGNDRGGLFRIDPATGASTFIGATGFGGDFDNGLSGLTLAPEPSHPLLVALGTLALIARRRRS